MNLPNPETRHEIFLASAAGMNVSKPEPITREEIYLNAIASGSGGDFDPDSYYTKPQTDARITEKVAEIVADAPEDFDTLKEMSDWISQHEESAAAMNTAIQKNTTAIAGKVDKASGKGLSTNDYTTTEKNKLAGIATGANKTVIDSALSSSSTNPVQNKVIKESLDNKVDKVTGKGLSTNDFTNADKTKLSGIEEGATKTIVDTELSSTSTNPVQNKAVQTLIARLVDAVAKNGFDIETAYTSSASNNTTNALSNSNLSVASNGTYARLSLPYLYKSGTAMFSCTVSEIAILGGTVQIRFAKNSDSSNSIANPINITGNDEYTREIVVEEDTPGYIIFYLNATGTSYQNSAIFSKIMVCTAEDYAISQKFVPYTPTMREIYEKLISIASQ